MNIILSESGFWTVTTVKLFLPIAIHSLKAGCKIMEQNAGVLFPGTNIYMILYSLPLLFFLSFSVRNIFTIAGETGKEKEQKPDVFDLYMLSHGPCVRSANYCIQ